MRLTTYQTGAGNQLGIVTARGVLDVAAAVAATGVNCPASVDEVYASGSAALPGLSALLDAAVDSSLFLKEADLTYGPAVPNPGKILCVGLNYQKHAAETGAAPPDEPVLFSKFNNSIAAPNESIPLQSDWTRVDYESELGVVIGGTARNVSVDEALDFVFGYCNMNDLSERRLQMLSGQWLLGKTLDKFLPLGPYVVTADEVPDPQNLSIKGWLNGELRQSSNTADMIFTVAEVIAYASKVMTLSPGDVISTGTPEGVIMGMEDKAWLKPGDVYSVEVEGLGQLVNRMVEA
ncbi:MAG: fumarylacetoacetate hydrolase family protein [Chloroflexota bacterium]|nr:fumarylacetoacetate hydrolase family protein [Chloroflexota bacterium]